MVGRDDTSKSHQQENFKGIKANIEYSKGGFPSLWKSDLGVVGGVERLVESVKKVNSRRNVRGDSSTHQ